MAKYLKYEFLGRCNDASASGSPLFLLTESHQVDPVLLSYNKQGLNFWIFDVEMDCSKTDAGWFEFKTVSVDGVWADDIHQHYECNGNTYRAQIPFESRNYVSMCGKINVFNHKPNECIINDIL